MSESAEGVIGVGARLSRIEELLENFIDTSREEIKEARHLAKNALQAAALQNVINDTVRRDIDRIDIRYSTDIKPMLLTLQNYTATHTGEDTFKKWLWPVILTAFSIAFAVGSFLYNLGGG